MIVEWFAKTMGDILVTVAGLVLPAMGASPVTLPSFVVYGYAWANRLLPLNEALAIVGVMLGAYALATAWHGILFVYHQFWGAS